MEAKQSVWLSVRYGIAVDQLAGREPCNRVSLSYSTASWSLLVLVLLLLLLLLYGTCQSRKALPLGLSGGIAQIIKGAEFRVVITTVLYWQQSADHICIPNDFSKYKLLLDALLCVLLLLLLSLLLCCAEAVRIQRKSSGQRAKNLTRCVSRRSLFDVTGRVQFQKPFLE